jgi:hypothetical protein
VSRTAGSVTVLSRPSIFEPPWVWWRLSILDGG